jgi:outer membrane protein
MGGRLAMRFSTRSLLLVSLTAALAVCDGARAEQPPLAAARQLSIRECIELALQNNLDLQIERLRPGIQSWGIIREQGAFEPALRGRASYRDDTQPLDPERQAALGLSAIHSEELRLRTSIDGRLPTGTEYELAAFDTRTQGTLAPDSVHVGGAALTLRQPLLRNFWLTPNTAALRVARKARHIADQQLAQQLIQTVSAVLAAYYELVFAIENHKAKIEDLNRARALLDENRRRVELGVLSPLEVTQAEAGAAERREAVIVAERQIRDQENALKRLIMRDVMELRDVAIEPLDRPQVQIADIDVTRSIQTALESRPDFLRLQHELQRRDILVQFNRNQLWPQVDLEGSYGLNARGPNAGRLADSLASAENPVWTVGVVVTIPLGNRQARANYHIARLEAEQAVLDLKRLEQDIIVEVDNAAGQVRTNLQRVEATRAARRLAEESLRAEETKLRTGASTSFQVLQAQAQLAAARSAEIRAQADYNKSLVELFRVEGTTLRRHNIELTNATPAAY